jgi:IPT/TIG domain
MARYGEAQQVPPASGARILLLPRKLVTGERATLAVLDVNGKLTPDVHVTFSNGDKITTDPTGRGLFVAPLTAGMIYAAIDGRTGHLSATILAPADAPSSSLQVTAAPRLASLSDRMEILGHGFCGDADANRVTIGGIPALVLASSPAYLAVLPPPEMDPGPVSVQIRCGQKSSDPFTVTFVNLELQSRTTTLAPGEHRTVQVSITGTTSKVNLEARNLAPTVADMSGGAVTRSISSGGKENIASFELVGKQRGSFVISIRLLAPLSPPHP